MVFVFDRISFDYDILETKKKAKIYQEYNTYVYIRTNTNFFNGYILQVLNDKFIFIDDVIPTPFPISFESLFAPIVPSKKNKIEVKE